MELKESTYTDSEAQERLRKDIVAMLFIEPFFASIISNTKKVVGTHVPIAGVAILGGEMVLFINPKGYYSYPLYERLFILIHEVLHLILFHHAREKNKIHKWWNMATDVAINQMIDTKSTVMPSDCLKVDSWEKSHGIVFPRNLDADHYYKMLKEQNKDLGLTDEMRKGTFGKQLSSASKEKNAQPAQSTTESTQATPASPKSTEPSESPMSTTDDPTQSPFDNMHPTWTMSDDTSKEVYEEVIRKAIEDAHAFSNGNVPGYLQSHVSEMLASKTNWRSIYRNFIAKKQNTNKKSTWKKRNRRFGSTVMGYKKSRKLTVLVGVDTSASITENDYRIFNGELLNMYKSGANIIIAECDAKVHSVYRYTPSNVPTFIGGGGTDFRPVFEFATSRSHKLISAPPDVIVILTDGAGPAPVSTSIPTLWCLTPNGRIPYAAGMNEIDWGTVIHIAP